jgi:electron transfer flavoprotein alpha subunit
VTGLRLDQDRIGFQRPVHGGRFLAETVSLTDGTVVTIQPGAFRELETWPPGKGSLELLSRPFPSSGTEVLGTKAAAQQDASVAEAEVIVAAGRGIGKQENLKLIHDLAALFPRSAVGGSRPLCDQGWLRYSQQVGLTGATVSPRLYIACGISGAYQHLAGMRESAFIVAINQDRRAAIFDWADVGIVEDLETFIPLLIEAWAKGRS